MASIADVIRPMLEDMSGGLGSMFGLKLSDVLKSPEAYSPSTSKLMSTISDTVIMPAATLVLVALFMLELVRISVSVDGDKELFAKIAAMTLVKFGLLRIIFEATPTVMDGIYQLFSYLARQADALTASATAVDSGDAEAFLQSVNDMDILGQLLLIMLMFIAWVVNKGAVIAALALVVVRFVKLFLYTAFAPMPIAFFAHQETRSFAIGFLRSFAGVVLQAFVLVLGFAIYETVTQGWASRAYNDLDSNGVAAALSIGGNFIFLGVILGMIILGSGRLANELVGN